MNKTLSIPSKSFPSPNDPFEQQKTIEYGLKVGKAIQYDWFAPANGSCKFFDHRAEFHRRRLYANGMQPIGKYKEYFAINGDMSYLKLDFTIVPVIPKFCDIIANGMAGREYSIEAYAVDPTSTKQRESYVKQMKLEMDNPEIFDAVQQGTGIDMRRTPKEKLPANDQELDLHMQLDYKPSYEQANELAIQAIFEENDFNNSVKTRVEKDLVDVGMGAVRHRYNPNIGITTEYVDGANLVWSYTEDPYFKDCFYYGEYKETNITEVYKEFPNLSPDQKEQLVMAAGSWSSMYAKTNTSAQQDNMKGKVGLLYFNYKSTRDKIWKKKNNKSGGSKIVEKANDFVYKGEENLDFEKLVKTEEVWFEGVMVLGTDLVLEWKVAKNMVKSNSNLNKAEANYVVCAPRMYKGFIDSLVNKMIPFADDIQKSWLKIQQIKQRLVPDGQYLDVDGLTDISLGNGNTYTVNDALNMYFQTGTVIGRSSTIGGEFNNAKVPITEIKHSSGQDKLASLWDGIEKSLNMIASTTGINQAVDASNPDKDSLVGIQKMAAYSSNVATRHLIKGSMYIIRELAKACSTRISDVLQFSETKDDFIRKIGRFAVQDLEEMKNLYLYDFAINIELHPDDEEKAKLEADISLEIQNQTLGTEDKYAILSIKNIKLATNFLALRKKKRAEEIQKNKMQEIQAQTQGNVESTNAATQSKAQLLQLETQAKVSVEDAKTKGQIAIMERESELKKELMAIEFQYNMQLNGVTEAKKKEADSYKEDRKDDRTKLQATQASKLIEQRQKEKAPVNFESVNDNLDAIDLSSFEPR